MTTTTRTGNGIYVNGTKIAIVVRTKDGVEVHEGERSSRCVVRRVRLLKTFKTVPVAVAFVHNFLGNEEA